MFAALPLVLVVLNAPVEVTPDILAISSVAPMLMDVDPEVRETVTAVVPTPAQVVPEAEAPSAMLVGTAMV